MQSAEDFRDLHQLEKSFKLWRDYTVMKQIERKQNNITAVSHYDRYLQASYTYESTYDHLDVLIIVFNYKFYLITIILRYLKKHILERWTRLVKEKDVISGREALKRRLEAKVLCAVPDYVPFSMREH